MSGLGGRPDLYTLAVKREESCAQLITATLPITERQRIFCANRRLTTILMQLHANKQKENEKWRITPLLSDIMQTLGPAENSLVFIRYISPFASE